MLCSGRGEDGAGRAGSEEKGGLLLLTDMPDTQRSWQRFMMCKSMAANKREGEGKTGKEQVSGTWREERRDREPGLLSQWRERGLGSIVHRLRARAGLPLGGPHCSVVWAIKFFILQQRIIFSCEATVVFIKPWAHSSMTTWAPCCSSTTRSRRPRSRSRLSIPPPLAPSCLRRRWQEGGAFSWRCRRPDPRCLGCTHHLHFWVKVPVKTI